MCLFYILAREGWPSAKVESSGFQNVVHRPLGIAKALSEGPWGQNSFHNNMKALSSSSTIWHWQWWCKKWWWMEELACGHEARQRPQIKRITSVIFYCDLVKRKCQFYLRTSLIKFKKLLMVINHNAWVPVFFLFGVTKWKVHTKHLCCTVKYNGWLKGKYLCHHLSWKVNCTYFKLSAFFSGTLFSLERTTEKLWPFKLEY